jgi:RES domain-containing protein
MHCDTEIGARQVRRILNALENNIVINPAHPAVERIQVDKQFKFMYDTRMFFE